VADDPEPELHSILRTGRAQGEAAAPKVVRFAEPPSPPAEEEAPDTSGDPAPGAQEPEEEDDDLNTLARTNHRVRAVQELYGLVADADMPQQDSHDSGRGRGSWSLPGAMQQQLSWGVETPKSTAAALSGPQSKEWRSAIDAEWKAMEDLKVWDKAPVPLPAGKTAVDGKFVFAPKLDAEGNVVRYRARFVARGFTQRPGSGLHRDFQQCCQVGHCQNGGGPEQQSTTGRSMWWMSRPPSSGHPWKKRCT